MPVQAYLTMVPEENVNSFAGQNFVYLSNGIYMVETYTRFKELGLTRCNPIEHPTQRHRQHRLFKKCMQEIEQLKDNTPGFNATKINGLYVMKVRRTKQDLHE